jgi:hypothetical protein
MIPERFFDFSVTVHSRLALLILGKTELCALAEAEATDSKVINKLRTRTSLVFEYLCQIYDLQPDARRANLSRKRNIGKQTLQKLTSSSMAMTTGMLIDSANE